MNSLLEWFKLVEIDPEAVPIASDWIKEHLNSVEMLLEAISIYYKDPTIPSLILAKINEKEYYVAVHRFSGAFAQDRYLLVKTKSNKLIEAYEAVAIKLLNLIASKGKGSLNADPIF